MGGCDVGGFMAQLAGTGRGEPWGDDVRVHVVACHRTGEDRIPPGTLAGQAGATSSHKASFPLCMGNWNLPHTLRLHFLLLPLFLLQ